MLILLIQQLIQCHGVVLVVLASVGNTFANTPTSAARADVASEERGCSRLLLVELRHSDVQAPRRAAAGNRHDVAGIKPVEAFVADYRALRQLSRSVAAMVWRAEDGLAASECELALRELHELRHRHRTMLCLDGVLLCDRVTPPFEWRLLVRRIRERIHTPHVCGWASTRVSAGCARQFTDRLQCFLACESCALVLT